VLWPEVDSQDFTALATNKEDPISFCWSYAAWQADSIGSFPVHWIRAARAEEIYMNLQEQIKDYIAIQPGPKRGEMQALHQIIVAMMPKCKLRFLDGRDEKGKTVFNPNIGYGNQTIKYADGKTKEFYQIGISANTAGISVYIMGISDKKYLAQTFGKKLGKASVTGYCIKFKTLSDIDIDALKAAIQYGIEQTSIQH
jgi:hypothetical protein